jgi:CheY-like chemotaxis protein
MRSVLAVVPDLFFSERIAGVARAAGVELTLVPPGQALARCAEARPALVLLDLHAPGDAAELIRTLKSDARTRAIPVVGFFSHVEIERRRTALAAGIDAALPRSAFFARLPALLAGEADLQLP